jgi:hypothetical protein
MTRREDDAGVVVPAQAEELGEQVRRDPKRRRQRKECEEGALGSARRFHLMLLTIHSH